MRAGALAPYEHALVTSAALHVQHRDGRTVPLDVHRWLAPADDADLSVVRQAVSPVLDVGCGPGRIVAALAEHGRFAIGVDIAATAVHLASERGVTALRRDVFAPLPGEGRWATVLLLDGNLGIGGDLDALLRRMYRLLRPGGRLFVETHADDTIDERHVVRFVLDGEPIGPEFAWRYVGLFALELAAQRGHFALDTATVVDGRTFVALRRAQDG